MRYPSKEKGHAHLPTKIEVLAFEFTSGSRDLPRDAAMILSRLLYTAFAEWPDHSTLQQFNILLSVAVETPHASLGVTSHVAPFFARYQNLVNLFRSGQEAELSDRIAGAAKIILHNSASISVGSGVPHRLSVIDGSFTLRPVDYEITIPGCSTSDLLVALSAAANGCVLAIHHDGTPTPRDTLLLEYLDKIKLGQPFSFDDFLCRDDNPEAWFLAPKAETSQRPK